MPAASIRFDRFELQPHERRLLADGEPVPLGARAFDVLLVLVSRAGSLVSKGELLDRVWAGLVVEEANLTVQVSGLRKVLGGELIATIPGRGYRFTGRVEAAPAASAGSPAPAPAPAPATPPPPQPVGRDVDLARLREALAARGCVTLAGPAGVGKTTLARTLAAHWPAGAVWVDLAALTEGDQVLAALARALGRPAPEAAASLLGTLGARLLVLDNAEHLIDAVAALVAALLAAAPAPTLLVTCQLPLAVPGERVHRVEPLALPGDDDADDAETAGALVLFIERARAADHRFAPGAASRPLLRAICRRLDGLPLAIEMAAARVAALGLKGLHDALEQRFAVLTRGTRTAAARHRTLQAALDWSHGLLGPDEQRLFRWLGVFAGGFTLELTVALVEELQPDRGAAIDTLATLVDRSLVATDDADPPRYRLLETMRAYALDRLRDTEELDAARLRHARVMRALFTDAAAPGPSGAPETGRARGLAEHDNAREALAWATARQPALAVELSTQVVIVASFVSWRAEAVDWLEACEPLIDDPSITDRVRTEWWVERARQLLIGARPDARPVAERACAIARQLGDAHLLFMALVALVRASRRSDSDVPALCQELEALHAAHPQWPPRTAMILAGTLAVACSLRRDYEGQLRHRSTELELARRHGTPTAVEVAESNLINCLYALKRHEEALARSDAFIAGFADRHNINFAYAWNTRLGLLAELGRHDELRALAVDSVRLFENYQMPYYLERWALLLAAEGRPRAAARMIGREMALFEQYRLAAPPASEATIDDLRTSVLPAIGDEGWQAETTNGRALDAAAALALLQPAPAEG